jgi:hypothetical protein
LQPGAEREPFLAAWGFTIEGRRVLLHMIAGAKEDAETVTAFFEAMKRRGLNDPLLVTSAEIFAKRSQYFLQFFERFACKFGARLAAARGERATTSAAANRGPKTRRTAVPATPIALNETYPEDSAATVVIASGMQLTSVRTCFSLAFAPRREHAQ